MGVQKFSANKNCMKYKQLLHYTSLDVLKIMLNNRTLKCNSLKNVNDLLERKRKGIEKLTESFYVACFCNRQYEIVPCWFLYGGCNPDNEKVLLRFKNFANSLDNVIEGDWAFTDETKQIFFDAKKVFTVNEGGISCCPIRDPHIENRQTIKTVRLFDVEYLLPNDEALLKEYKTSGNVSFGKGGTTFPTQISDVRSIGKYKTIHWGYEYETRIQCTMNPMDIFYFNYILLRLKDEIFRDMVIVANPWASDRFIAEIGTALSDSTLNGDIKKSIVVQRSELDGQIDERD